MYGKLFEQKEKLGEGNLLSFSFVRKEKDEIWKIKEIYFLEQAVYCC